MASLLRSEQEKFPDYGAPSCQAEIESQLEAIWSAAAEAELILDYCKLNAWSEPFEQDVGAEHVAILIPENGRVYKRTLGSLSGELFGLEKLPLPYLLNQALISVFFGTETLFEGVSRRPEEGTTEFLISQRYIKAADPENPYPSDSEVVEFFRQKGFLASQGPGGDVVYINEALGLGIVDSHPGNFIVNAEGIKPFDIHFEILNEDSVVAVSRILEAH